MKKIIIAALTMLTLGATQAEYTAKIPLEISEGGSLPNGSITFTNQEPTAPILDCVNNPEENPTECQERLNAWEAFADARGLFKDWNNLGWGDEALTTIPTEPYPLTSVNYLYLYSNQLTNVDGLSNLTSVGSISLDENNLTNVDGLSNLTSVAYLSLEDNNLTNVDGLINLTSVPELYLSSNKLTNVDGLSNLTSVAYLDLSTNQLTNINSLSNLTSVNYLDLSTNQLTNVDGLSNLTSVDVLDLARNQLTNVDGLINLTGGNSNLIYLANNQLTNVDGLSNLTSISQLDLSTNQLTNINGLANLEIMQYIVIDATYAGPKLAATTRFCSLNSPAKFEFDVGLAQKSQLCNP